MVKDIITLLSVDGIAGTIIGIADPTFLKWVLGAGCISLIALLMLTKQGRVSIYGTQLIMALIIAIHLG